MRNARITLVVGVVFAFSIAACDSGVTNDTEQLSELNGDATFGKVEKVAVCHVGHMLPEYDPTCTEGCGDAGKIDLVTVPQKAADKHFDNDHTYDGVSDYLPGDEGATGVGTEDTDGNGIDDGCEIPLEETIFAVAYTDNNPNDGDYNPAAGDILIAKWVDGGLPGVGPGDIVITNRYPTDDTGQNTAAFQTTQHVVTSVFTGIPNGLGGFDTNGYYFEFREIYPVLPFPTFYERYYEHLGDGPSPTSTLVVDGIDDPSGAGVILVDPVSPSNPEQEVPGTVVGTPGDDAFIDVDICLDGC